MDCPRSFKTRSKLDSWQQSSIHGYSVKLMTGVAECLIVDNLHRNLSLFSKNESPAARVVLDLIPCAIAIWSSDRVFSIFNRAARQLLGLKDSDLQRDPSLWINRIHPQDRGLFGAAWKKLLAGENKICCDYRFSPNEGEKDIWIRDMSVSHQNPSGEIDGVTSAYIDVSDLRTHLPKSREERRLANVGKILDSIVHGVKNDLQIINLGLDLMRLTGSRLSECQPLFEGVERINRSIQDLREFVSPPEPQLSRGNPKVFLEELVREMGRELNRQKIHLRARCLGSMRSVQLDWNEFRRALDQVIEFSRLLLPQGGELEIRTGLQELDGKQQIELQISCSSATSLTVEEGDVFRPFLKVNGSQTGLGIALAREILCRQNGDISFQKQNTKRGLFTISLETH
jgi:signal transduction histidine kinase